MTVDSALKTLRLSASVVIGSPSVPITLVFLCSSNRAFSSASLVILFLSTDAVFAFVLELFVGFLVACAAFFTTGSTFSFTTCFVCLTAAFTCCWAFARKGNPTMYRDILSIIYYDFDPRILLF